MLLINTGEIEQNVHNFKDVLSKPQTILKSMSTFQELSLALQTAKISGNGEISYIKNTLNFRCL